jgi:hypothetical protein
MSSTSGILKLCCRIKLGIFSFNYVSDVEIKSDVENLTDTCSITLPRALFFEGKPLREYLKRGDAVLIELGYNDDFNTVFRGFIKNLKMGTPLVVECEDNMFILKKVLIKPKTYSTLTMKQLIDEYLPKDIEREVLDFKLGNFIIQSETSLTKILEYITDTYKVRFFFRGGKFYAAMPHTQAFKEGVTTVHKFEFERNIISDNIDYQYKDDVNITIVCKSIQNDNSVIEVREPAGKEQEVRTYYFNNKSRDELKQLAKERIALYKYDGLKGSFTAFGIPFVQISDAVNLIDKRNEERNGKTYLVKGVKYSFGRNGYRQDIELSYKL